MSSTFWDIVDFINRKTIEALPEAARYCQLEPGSGRIRPMDDAAVSYRGYRFPPEIISHAVWLYFRFALSFRDVEDLLAERRIEVSYETIRRWCQRFGVEYARRLRRRKKERPNDTWHLDEMFIKINGKQFYLWRAVDQDATWQGEDIRVLR